MKKVFQKIRDQHNFLTEEDVNYLLTEHHDKCKMLPVLLRYGHGRCIVKLKDLSYLIGIIEDDDGNAGYVRDVQIAGGELRDYWTRLGYNFK